MRSRTKALLSWCRTRGRDTLFHVLDRSLIFAGKQQQIDTLAYTLENIVPNIANQYTTFSVGGTYLRRKVRLLHAFQMSLLLEVVPSFDAPTVIDIGDSSGTHLQYLMAMCPQIRDAVSVNLDTAAVQKIQAKGLHALCARVEDLESHNVKGDIVICFETLEHLENPIQFLHMIATRTPVRRLIITVPFVRTSRVGLHHIRCERHESVTAENTHIFELCPQDWKLLAQHSGWSIVKDRVYKQYPFWHWYYLTRWLWRKYDFEGFYGMILEKNPYWSSHYLDWHV